MSRLFTNLKKYGTFNTEEGYINMYHATCTRQPSGPALGLTKPATYGYQSLVPGAGSGLGVLTSLIYLVPMLRIRGAIHLPPHTISWRGA